LDGIFVWADAGVSFFPCSFFFFYLFFFYFPLVELIELIGAADDSCPN